MSVGNKTTRRRISHVMKIGFVVEILKVKVKK